MIMNISDNLKMIQNRIKESAFKANRDPSKITLIAVSKYVGPELMNEAIRAGITDFGENRIQDALEKFPLLEGKVTRHLIGTLQTNKVKPALENFDLIHSVDRISLLDELAKQAARFGKRTEFLVQVNISGERTKHGLNPDELPSFLQRISGNEYLVPCGLMTLAPLADDSELARPVFRGLKMLFDQAARSLKSEYWRYLSMGMSQDYQVAVEEGANLLRIGTAIFKSE